MKKILSIILVAVLTVTAVAAVPLYPSAAAGSSEDPGNIRLFTYGSTDSFNMVIYNDEVFNADPTVYDPQLAVMSAALGSASCNSYRVDESTKYTRMSRNAYEYLEDCGFSDIYVNDDYKLKPNGSRAPAIFGHKTISDNKGKEYTLLALVPKGGAMGAEYYNVPKASSGSKDTGDFAYMDELKRKTLVSTRKYIKDYGIQGDIKIWLPGYSRGGGVANLIAAEIIDHPKDALGSSVKVADNGLYCYSLSSYRAVEASADMQADRYSCIHNLITETDMIVNLPWEKMDFGWYGKVHEITSLSEKDEFLRLLSFSNPKDYERYLNGADPDDYSPMKLDLKALLNGSLSLTPDDDSYLPESQAEYIDSVMEPIIELFGEDSDDTRAGYYKNYQEAMINFITYYHDYKFPEASALLGSKTAIPFVLSEYISAIVDKSVENGNINNAELSAAAEDAFNVLAYIIEDEDGNFRIKTGSEKLKKAEAAYKLIRTLYFMENSDPEVNKLKIPQKYSLRSEIRFDRLFADRVHRLAARLYSLTMNDVFTAQGVDPELISKMTSEKDSAAMSRFLAHILFDNAEQSGRIRPIDPENEQFKQLATLINTYKSCATLHYVEVAMSWLQGGCPLYSDFEGMTDDQMTGYRRVYIGDTGDADVSGIVRDESGNTVASFRNGRMLAKSDGWIGYTLSDDGGWLRLPMTHSYTVELKTSEDTELDLKLAEYSSVEGKEVRSAKWKDLKAYENGSVVLTVPEIAAGEEGYALPSAVRYDVKVSGSAAPDADDTGEKTVYSKAVPKVKTVKAKAGRRSMTVSWKKLKASQRRKFSKVEVQYSTSKKFKTYKTLEVSKKKASVRIKGLRKGKTYYVRIRNVKKGDGISYVSKWSSKKKVRIK